MKVTCGVQFILSTCDDRVNVTFFFLFQFQGSSTMIKVPIEKFALMKLFYRSPKTDDIEALDNCRQFVEKVNRTNVEHLC